MSLEANQMIEYKRQELLMKLINKKICMSRDIGVHGNVLSGILMACQRILVILSSKSTKRIRLNRVSA